MIMFILKIAEIQVSILKGTILGQFNSCVLHKNIQNKAN